MARYDSWYRDQRRYDDEITWRVRQRLFEDIWLDARDIDIDVEARVVTLSGWVRDYLEARYAWDDAWETEGVRGVISRLEVRGAKQPRVNAGAAP